MELKAEQDQGVSSQIKTRLFLLYLNLGRAQKNSKNLGLILIPKLKRWYKSKR